jgi:hypothetical protein
MPVSPIAFFVSRSRFPINLIFLFFPSPGEARGPVWARGVIQEQMLLSNLDRFSYYMQIDAHTRFVDSWDAIAISMLQDCPSDKPVLSIYPPDFSDMSATTPFPPLALTAARFDEDGMLRIVGKRIKDTQSFPQPFPGAFLGTLTTMIFPSTSYGFAAFCKSHALP